MLDSMLWVLLTRYRAMPITRTMMSMSSLSSHNIVMLLIADLYRYFWVACSSVVRSQNDGRLFSLLRCTRTRRFGACYFVFIHLLLSFHSFCFVLYQAYHSNRR